MGPRSFTTGSAAQTAAAGRALAALLEPGDVLLLTGDLGAGKTQLVKGIAAGLGVAEEVTSPTFNILLVHGGRVPLYHVDLYRLDSAEQLDDIDWWGIVEGDGVAAVEWGDRFPEAAPRDYVAVELHATGDEQREVALSPHGERGVALAGAWLDALRDADEGTP